MINKVILIGNLGADPEQRYTANGTAVSNFNIACTERFKGQDGEWHERTEWVKVVAFGRLAEICGEYLTKGKQVYIEGRLQTRKWEDNSGQTRYTTEVVAREMKMLGGRGGGSVGGGSRNSQNNRQEPPVSEPSYDDYEDDIPF